MIRGFPSIIVIDSKGRAIQATLMTHTAETVKLRVVGGREISLAELQRAVAIFVALFVAKEHGA